MMLLLLNHHEGSSQRPMQGVFSKTLLFKALPGRYGEGDS